MSLYQPPPLDVHHPGASRICAWLLGEDGHWAVDRELGEKAVAAFPSLPAITRLTREFVSHAVRCCLGQGIVQFLDIGCGLPLRRNIHDIVDEYGETGRCVYIEQEPVAAAKMLLRLEDDFDPVRHMLIRSDLRADDLPDLAFLPHGPLDREQPTALIASSVLHHLGPADGGKEAIVRYLRELPTRSCLVATHLTTDGVPNEQASQLEALRALYSGVNPPLYYRTRTAVTDFFVDLQLAEPGVTWLPHWLPNVDATTDACPGGSAGTGLLAGIGWKR
jgi:hypothetical protein